jgi:hypothetical protein
VNYLELARRLHRESLRSTAAPTSVTGASIEHSRLFDWVQDAWHELQIERNWRWMRATIDAALTSGQQSYDSSELGATNFDSWRQNDEAYWPVVYTTGQPNSLWHLDFWQLNQFRQEWVWRDWGSTVPTCWTFDETDQLLLGPKPGADLSIRAEYLKAATALTADTDIPNMPERFHMLLVWRALKEVSIADAAPELLARADANWRAMKNALMVDQAWPFR